MSQAQINLLRVLKSAVESDDLKLVERTSGQILVSAPRDEDATHCKLIALLLQNKYKQALTFINRHPEMLPKHLFHKAYCLYRNRQDQKCMGILRSIPQQDRHEGVVALEGQIKYRRGDAKSVVTSLEGFSPSTEEDKRELQTNIIAACVVSGQYDKAIALGRSQSNNSPSYEFLYNWSCAALYKQEYKKALSLVDRATRVCRRTLNEDDADEEEVEQSIAVLKVQRAFALQQMQDTEEAMKLYQSVLKSKPSDEAVTAVASNNIVTLRSKDQKLFDSLKKSQRASNVLPAKLTLSQREGILFNRCLLLIMAKQGDKARKTVSSFRQQFPESEFPVFADAFLSYSEQKFDVCVQLLQSVGAERPNDALQCQLTLAQIQIERNDVKSAIATLKSIPDVPFQPAGVATLVALHERINDVEGACTVFHQAIKYWDQRKNADNLDILHTLLLKSAEYMLKHKRFAEAATSYERLVSEFKDKSSSEYLRIVAELVTVASNVDPALALKFAPQLPPVDGVEDIDLESLEVVAFTRADRKKAERRNDPRAMDVEMKSRKKKKKKRKRLPKNYDPNGPAPDPERWLPRWERKSYRGRKRRKPKTGGGQGMVNEAKTARLDRTKQRDTPKQKMQAVLGAGGGQKTNRNKKKKRRRGNRR